MVRQKKMPCVNCDLDLGDMTLTVKIMIQLCDILSRSNMAVRSYGPDTVFSIYVHNDLDLGDMTLAQGHDAPIGHVQQLCEMICRSNTAVRSNGPDMDLGYACNMT